MNDFRLAMMESIGYIKKNKELLLEFFNSSKILSCEGNPDEIALHLDTSCGIDMITVYKDDDVSRGVGCRFQPDKTGRPKYETFTIRKERDTGTRTEFEKRKIAIAKGGLYPYWTLHGYVDGDGVIDRMAVAKTEDIINYIENERPYVLHTGTDQIGQASFYVISWKDFKKKYKMKKYPKSLQISMFGGDDP